MSKGAELTSIFKFRAAKQAESQEQEKSKKCVLVQRLLSDRNAIKANRTDAADAGRESCNAAASSRFVQFQCTTVTTLLYPKLLYLQNYIAALYNSL